MHCQPGKRRWDVDAKWAVSMLVTILVAISGSCFSLGSRLGSLEEGQKSTDQRFADFGRQVDRMERATERLDGYVRRLDESVGALERNVKRLDAGAGTIEGLEGRFLALQAEHNGLQGSVDRLRTTRGGVSEELGTQLRRIEERLNEVAAKVGVPVKGAS
jgi:chromosome segregation ATPase